MNRLYCPKAEKLCKSTINWLAFETGFQKWLTPIAAHKHGIALCSSKAVYYTLSDYCFGLKTCITSGLVSIKGPPIKSMQ